jgi:hypothetical protein
LAHTWRSIASSPITRGISDTLTSAVRTGPLADELGRPRARQRRHVHFGLHRLGACEAREVEQAVDQLRHLARVGLDLHEQLVAVGIEAVGVLLAQDRREAVDRAQRRAQVVRDAVRERLELRRWCASSSTRALRDVVLEVLVQAPQQRLAVAQRLLGAAPVLDLLLSCSWACAASARVLGDRASSSAHALRRSASTARARSTRPRGRLLRAASDATLGIAKAPV